MERLEIAIYTFKGLLTLTGAWLLKNAKPFLKALKRLSAVSDRVDVLDEEVSILKSKQMASIETSTVPVFITNEKGELIYANPALAEMTGFTNIDDAYGTGYMEAILPEDYEQVERIMERLVRHPTSYEGKIRFRHIKTQEKITTICRSEPVKNRNGKAVETIWRLKII